ncbi:MAG TPA: signal peptidase I [Clostridia bacterium]|nr:signal peptidase I [Clostridia bacterium]
MTDSDCVGSVGQIATHGSACSPARLRALFRQIAQWLCVGLLALLSYWIISHFFLTTVSVVGVSMTPTLQDSERYLLNRWVFIFRAPRDSEVVVLRDPLDGFSVKRVVAGPGATVYLKEGKVYVDGTQLQESYLAPGMPTFTQGKTREQLFRCEADQFFVLGDNRQNSVDSRAYGPISRQNILGLIIH